MLAEPFAAKLALLLKALAISRGRLAADLNLNKSVVSRWHSGHATPSGENLSRLTRLIADRLPGFTGLDWDRDLAGLTGLLGHAPSSAVPPGPAASDSPGFARIAETRDLSLRQGESWTGHWWGYRQTFRDEDQLVRDLIRIRRCGDFLKMDWRNDVVAGDGWFMVGDGKAYVLLPHRYADTPAMIFLYTMDGKRVQFLDGLISTVTILAGRAMIAAPYVMERAADLLADPAADDAFFANRAPDDWRIDADSLAPAIRQRLMPAIAADGVLRIASDTSLTRFCTPAEERASAAAAIAGG